MRHALNYELTQVDNRKTIMSLCQRHTNSLLQDIPGMENLSLIDQINGIEEDKVHSTVRDCFNRLWRNEIDTFPKADSFKQFKDSINFERYLEDIKVRKHRVSLAKLRLSDHCLMIEKGRYYRPPILREERWCPHCPLVVENEEHFVTECPAYNRVAIFTQISDIAPQFAQLNSHDKFIYLMSQEDRGTLQEFAKQVHKWLMSRLDFEDQQKEIDNILSTIEIQ